MRKMSVISGHPIFTGFRRLTGCQRDPRDRGVIGSLPKIGTSKPKILNYESFEHLLSHRDEPKQNSDKFGPQIRGPLSKNFSQKNI